MIERLVSAFVNKFPRWITLGFESNSDGNRHGYNFSLKLKNMPFDGGTDTLADFLGLTGRRTEQQQGEFLAAEPREKVVAADQFVPDHHRDFLQHEIAGH